MDSVAEIDFYGRDKKHLWCRTHTENLYLWDWNAACDEELEGKSRVQMSGFDIAERIDFIHYIYFTALIP